MSNLQEVTNERHSIFHRNDEIVWNQVDHVPGERNSIRVKGEVLMAPMPFWI